MSDLRDPYRRTGKLHGHCLCGACTIDVDGDYVAAVGICHCTMCQRSNGVVFGAFEASPDAVTTNGPVQCYASSSFAERAFCGTCGSALWLRDTTDKPAGFELMPGLFEEAATFPLISEIYCNKAPAYLPFAGDHKRGTQAEYEAKNLFVADDDIGIAGGKQ